MKNETLNIECLQIEPTGGKHCYLINGRKSGGQSLVHAFSPDIQIKNIHFKAALYFISCDFAGSDSEYALPKLEAVKAYLETLKVPYKIIVCDALPRHNWKQLLRLKNISSIRFDELMFENDNNGKNAAEEFFLELAKADNRSDPLAEDEIDRFATKITIAANKAHLELCEEIFSKNNTLAWSSFLPVLSREFEKYIEPLVQCEKSIIDSAKLRKGFLDDNIAYKQEELIVGFYLGNAMKNEFGNYAVFYNRFSSHQVHTGHMKACEAYGHFPILDIRFCEEAVIRLAQIKQEILEWFGFLVRFDEYFQAIYNAPAQSNFPEDKITETMSSSKYKLLFGFKSNLKANVANTEKFVDKNGLNPLHLMSMFAHSLYKDTYGGSQNVNAMASTLIAANANPNATDKFGRTPLHWAIIWDNTKIAKFLIQAGARGDIKDVSGTTPLRWAQSKKNHEIITLLNESQENTMKKTFIIPPRNDVM